MRIHYMSDLHLEFGAFDKKMPSGEVLILAGDITTLAHLEEEGISDDPFIMERARSVQFRAMAFFERASANFDRIYYLFGNHEPYGGDITRLSGIVNKAIIPKFKNVSILSNDVVEFGDVVLVGGTLWTDMGNNNPQAHALVGYGMNDFRIVRNGRGWWTTHDAYRAHVKTRQLISRTAVKNKDKRVIVATHHAPSFKGINPIHGGNRLDVGYASDMEQFIIDRPNITHWIHGHTHVQTSYMVGHCSVHANCRGYIGHEKCSETFDPNTYIEV